MTEHKSIYPNLKNNSENPAEKGMEEPKIQDNTTPSGEGNGFIDYINNGLNNIIEKKEPGGSPSAKDKNVVIEKKATTSIFKDFLRVWKKDDTIIDKHKMRNEINDAFISKTAVEVDEDNMMTVLNRGDFFIARRIWDMTEGKFHDHFVFVKERNEDHLNVIYISDISERGSKPKEEKWMFEMLKENIQNETVALLRFDFLGVQDDSDKIIERALAYRIPKKETRSFHFASTCAFGQKLPIFSPDQLTLCSENTLLVLKNKEANTNEKNIVMTLKSVEDDGTLNISFNNYFTTISLLFQTSEIKQYYKEELFYYSGGQYYIYYVPESPVTEEDKKTFMDEVLSEKVNQAKKEGTKMLVKKGIKVGMRETVTEVMKSSLAGKLLAPKVAKAIGTKAAGPVLDVAIGSGEAGVATYKSRQKEKVYEESGCVVGYSRTRANKAISLHWSSAASGVAGGLGTAALLTTGAAVAGQMMIPIPFVGAVVGSAVAVPFIYAGSAIGGVAAGKIGGLVSSKIYDKNMETKCPFCQRYTKKSYADKYMPQSLHTTNIPHDTTGIAALLQSATTLHQRTIKPIDMEA